MGIFGCFITKHEETPNRSSILSEFCPKINGTYERNKELLPTIVAFLEGKITSKEIKRKKFLCNKNHKLVGIFHRAFSKGRRNSKSVPSPILLKFQPEIEDHEISPIYVFLEKGKRNDKQKKKKKEASEKNQELVEIFHRTFSRRRRNSKSQFFLVCLKFSPETATK